MPAPFGTDPCQLFDPRVLRYLMVDMCTTPQPSAAQIAQNLLDGHTRPLTVLWTIAAALKSDEVVIQAHTVQTQDYQRHPTIEELQALLSEVLNALIANIGIHRAFEQLGVLMGFVREFNSVAADSLERTYAQALQAPENQEGQANTSE